MYAGILCSPVHSLSWNCICTALLVMHRQSVSRFLVIVTIGDDWWWRVYSLFNIACVGGEDILNSRSGCIMENDVSFLATVNLLKATLRSLGWILGIVCSQFWPFSSFIPTLSLDMIRIALTRDTDFYRSTSKVAVKFTRICLSG